MKNLHLEGSAIKELAAHYDAFESNLENFLKGNLGDRQAFIDAWIKYECSFKKHCFFSEQSSSWELLRGNLEAVLGKALGVTSIISIGDAVAQAVRHERHLVDLEHDVELICEHLGVQHVAIVGVLIEPDPMELPPSRLSDEKFQRVVKYQPRLQMLLRELTEEKEIHQDRIRVTSGELRDKQMRTVSYALIEVEGIDGGILVCNQVGEVTYVNFESKDIAFYESQGKLALNNDPSLTRVVCRNLNNWKENVIDLFLGVRVPSQIVDVFVNGNPIDEEHLHQKILDLLEENKIISLDSDLSIKSLADLFGLTGVVSQLTIAKCLVEQGYLSADVPDDYVFQRSDALKRYLNPEIVGDFQAKLNIRKAINDWIVRDHINLDNLTSFQSIATLLGIEFKPTSTRCLAKALISQNYLSANVPDDYGVEGYGNKYYFEEEVVGTEQAKQNIRKVLSEWIKKNGINLDNIPQLENLGKLLGLKEKMRNLSFIAKALVDQGYVSPEISDAYGFGQKGQQRRYLNPEVVGKEKAAENIRKVISFWINQNKITLDTIPKFKALGSLLGLPAELSQVPSHIAKKLITEKYLSAEVPEDYQFTGRKNINYLDPSIVGEEQAKKNIRKAIADWLIKNNITLDNIPQLTALSSLLGLNGSQRANKTALASALVAQGYLSATVPDDYSFFAKTRGCRYFESEVVGTEVAQNNIRKAIKDWISRDNIVEENVPSSMMLAGMLGLHKDSIPGKMEITQALIEQGYLKNC